MKTIVLAGGFVLFAVAQWVAAHDYQMGIHRSSSSWWLRGQLTGNDITEAATGPVDSTNLFQFVEESTTQYAFQSAPFSSLTNLLNGLGYQKDWDLTVKTNASESTYRYFFAGAEESSFAEVPALAPVQEPVGQTPTFTWSWSGTADAKIFEFVQWNETHQQVREGSYIVYHDEEGFDSLEQTLNLLPVPGMVEVRVIYVNLTSTMISDWSLKKGDDIIGGNRLFYLASYDDNNVQVVPEPMSAAMLIGGGVFRRPFGLAVSARAAPLTAVSVGDHGRRERHRGCHRSRKPVVAWADRWDTSAMRSDRAPCFRDGGGGRRRDRGVEAGDRAGGPVPSLAPAAGRDRTTALRRPARTVWRGERKGGGV